MAREHDSAPPWRSMSEEPEAPKHLSPPSPQRKVLSQDIERLKFRRRRLYALLGAMAGLLLALPMIALSLPRPKEVRAR